MMYILIAFIVFFVCCTAAVIFYKVWEEKPDEEAIVALAAVSAVYSLLWVIAVPLTVLGGVAYGLSSLAANVIKKRRAKKNG